MSMQHFCILSPRKVLLCYVVHHAIVERIFQLLAYPTAASLAAMWVAARFVKPSEVVCCLVNLDRSGMFRSNMCKVNR